MTAPRPTAPLDPTPIGFRPLTTDDLPQPRHWLTTPHVACWWYETEPITLEWVTAKYAPRIAGREPTDCFIILYTGRPIGFIQTYRLADYPAYNQAVAVAEEAAGVDLFIPDEPAPEYLMRLGRDEWPVATIASTLAQVVHRLAATACCLPPPASWGPPWT